MWLFSFWCSTATHYYINSKKRININHWSLTTSLTKKQLCLNLTLFGISQIILLDVFNSIKCLLNIINSILLYYLVNLKLPSIILLYNWCSAVDLCILVYELKVLSHYPTNLFVKRMALKQNFMRKQFNFNWFKA